MTHSMPLPPPFLIAGHLALDFVNSLATPSHEPVEWLGDGRALLDWAAAAEVFPQSRLRQLQKAVSPRVLDQLAGEARDLREVFRAELGKKGGYSSSATLRERINDVMACGAATHELRLQADGPRLEEVERLDTPRQLLVPLAKAMAALIVEEDPTRVRACEGSGCTLWFVDRTKTSRRRFCSASVCGNRAKVAAYRARQRES